MNALEQLRGLAAELPADGPVTVRRVASGSAFVARQAASFSQVRHGRSFVSLVLSGKKTTTFKGAASVLKAGDVLVVPAGVEYSAKVTAGTCVFILEIDGDAAAAFARLHPGESRSAQLGAFETNRIHVLQANEATLLSFAHVAATLQGAAVKPAVLRHRLEDLVLSLSLQHLDVAETTDAGADPVLATRLLVRSDLASAWSVSDVAQKLAMSPATLRRKLAGDGTSLRRIRVEERMTVAAALLTRRGSTVAEVAAQCGYESPSKFARQFRLRFGRAPRASA
ncbi:MAG: helix-turn-helix transcriptional regulator [Myxococcaceae bacterium]|nr:helix-turn-helix transcriptional regulator [Myxococcaceae bacterium]